MGKVTKLLSNILNWIKSIPADKLMHFVVSLIIAFSVTAFMDLFISKWLSFIIGSLITLLIGLSKELYDYLGHGDAEWRDIRADVIGLILGSLMAIL